MRMLWMKAAILTICGTMTILTGCSTQDNAVFDPVNPEVKDYVERLVPVVDPQGAPQGSVILRFYNDMPSVAYVSVGNFQGIMYPGTTVTAVKTAPDQYTTVCSIYPYIMLYITCYESIASFFSCKSQHRAPGS